MSCLLLTKHLCPGGEMVKFKVYPDRETLDKEYALVISASDQYAMMPFLGPVLTEAVIIQGGVTVLPVTRCAEEPR